MLPTIGILKWPLEIVGCSPLSFMHSYSDFCTVNSVTSQLGWNKAFTSAVMFFIIANLHWGNWAPDRILTYDILIGWQVLQPLCNNQLGKVDFCGGIFAERHDVMQKGPRVRDPWVPDDHFWAEVLCPICVFVCVTHCVIVSFSECGCVWVSVSLDVCLCVCVCVRVKLCV